ncbi:fibronectin type III domain-containing protein [Nocardioides guangzhouensis]|uniref:fibronectin type III domain-containing protein n=1 Tax=Nocardioides guangzhouensis TaxID=2497878 RepID=UPI0014385F0A|nr:fibronectin type III domain-containing protein [Nocardioides guangzhouensis]
MTSTIIRSDTTWPASGSPYLVQGPVQIAAGSTLTIEAGAEVVVDSSFQLEGGLTVAGTAEAPVRIQTDVPLFQSAGTAYNEPTRQARIRHANITGPGALMGTGNSRYLGIEITDSRISDVSARNYIWYPTKLVLERNVFTRVNTLDIGTNHVAAVIRNNRFRQTPTGGFSGYNGTSQVVSWAAYGTPLLVEGNVFETSIRPRILEVSIDGAMDASNNYFGSTDITEVKGWVADKDDNLNRPGVVDVEPLLASPPTEVPAVEPAAPNSVTATRGDREATLSWQAPGTDGGTPVTGYEVTVSPGNRTLTLPAEATGTTVDGLTNGVAYTYAVTAVNAAGTSAAATATAVPAGLPGAPTNVTASREDGAAVVRWTAADPNGAAVSGHVITVEPGGATVAVGTDTFGVVRDLVNGGGPYTFTVQAVNPVGVGSASAASNGVVPAGNPLQVPTPTVVRGDRSVQVSWAGAAEGNGAPISSYVVTASPGGAMAGTGPDGRTVRVTGLVNGRTYRFTLMAMNEAGGRSVSEPSASVVPATTPNRVGSVRAARTGRKVVLTWRRPGNGGTALIGYVVTDNGRVVGRPGASATRLVLPRVRSGLHSYRIGAVNRVGRGPWSATVRVRVP